MSQINTITYGGDLMLFASSGTTAAVQPLAFSTNAKLSIDLKTRDVSSKDSGYWTEKAPAKFTWNVSSDGLYAYANTGTTQTISKLYTIYCNRNLVCMAFAAKCGTSPSWGVCATNKFSGCMLITKLDVDSKDDSTVTYALSGEGSGALSFA